MIVGSKIEKFVSSLIARLENEQVFGSIIKEMKFTEENWDTVAKKLIGPVVRQVFKQIFPEEDVQKAVYVEGEVGFELFMGRFESKKWPYNLFGGIGVYPDIAILSPERILIELDNSGAPRQGLCGSKFKTALAKAAFGYMTGEWDYCLMFFHNRSGKNMEQFLKREREIKILEKYKTVFHTEHFLFEPDNVNEAHA